ncbi:hypothetical protein DTO271D3_6727 [Paecilomyces variotii]|nr:hypothetical protein DTO217A2_3628 [Paecilomyces variotii]KAJ9312967.1 hypothetical protein DTO271D3_6727 [Paecilomyces variotii]
MSSRSATVTGRNSIISNLGQPQYRLVGFGAHANNAEDVLSLLSVKLSKIHGNSWFFDFILQKVIAHL